MGEIFRGLERPLKLIVTVERIPYDQPQALSPQVLRLALHSLCLCPLGRLVSGPLLVGCACGSRVWSVRYLL